MATAPAVQNLDAVMAELNPIYQSSINAVNAQKGIIPQKYDAQRQALEAAKVQGFDQINNQATGRGGSFSGVPVNEQSKYLSTTYLPGMQQANFQQNADMLALDQALAQIDLQRGQQAFGIRESQQSALNQYLLQQQQQEFQAAENALDRAQQARLAASRGGGGGSSSGSGTPNAQQYIAGMFSQIGSDANWKTNGATESSGLMGSLVANYGYTPEQASAAVYNWRKQYYGF